MKSGIRNWEITEYFMFCPKCSSYVGAPEGRVWGFGVWGVGLANGVGYQLTTPRWLVLAGADNQDQQQQHLNLIHAFAPWRFGSRNSLKPLEQTIEERLIYFCSPDPAIKLKMNQDEPPPPEEAAKMARYVLHSSSKINLVGTLSSQTTTDI